MQQPMKLLALFQRCRSLYRVTRGHHVLAATVSNADKNTSSTSNAIVADGKTGHRTCQFYGRIKQDCLRLKRGLTLSVDAGTVPLLSE